VIGYGHMGDSNLHLNVACRRYEKKVEEALEPWVYEWVKKYNGSISAEHGLGIAKKDYIGYSRSDTMVGLMKGVKGLLDPVSPFRLLPVRMMHLTNGSGFLIEEGNYEPVQVHLSTCQHSF
jgi:FAD/FMN-containing dehydrogenase